MENMLTIIYIIYNTVLAKNKLERSAIFNVQKKMEKMCAKSINFQLKFFYDLVFIFIFFHNTFLYNIRVLRMLCFNIRKTFSFETHFRIRNKCFFFSKS